VQQNYYNYVRAEIAPLLPKRARRIVDVGCGAGETSAWLKTFFPDARLVGVECNPALRSELEGKLDEVHIVDLNAEAPAVGAADLYLFLDVLEHLNKPEEILRLLTSDMPADARVVVSLPNIAHVSVSVPLFFRGQFEYRDAGILDRTHVRFFVRDTAVRLMNDAGLRVEKGVRNGLEGPRSRFLDRVTGGLLRDRLTKQYVLLATPMRPGESQGPIEWLSGRL
jgi:2-polyprenyl-3-methyl-5-hydroxy-6-metoxy-1,4-benzoquinol methylase